MTVEEWVKAAHEPTFCRAPVMMTHWEANIRFARIFYRLISEEETELSAALSGMRKGGFMSGIEWTAVKVAIVDALGDIMWLCATMLTCMGIDWQKVIERIAESNATKLLDGEIYPDVHGKIRKGEHYVSPKLDDLV